MAKSKAEWVLRFKQEATQHLIQLDKALRVGADPTLLEAGLPLNQAEIDNLRELFRLAHTVKGSAAMVGQLETAELARNLEQIFSEPFHAEVRLSLKQRATAQTLLNQLQQKLNQIEISPPPETYWTDTP